MVEFFTGTCSCGRPGQPVHLPNAPATLTLCDECASREYTRAALWRLLKVALFLACCAGIAVWQGWF